MRGGRKKGSAARPPTDRRHRRRKGEREAIGDRPSTRLGTAEKPATLHGQSVAGYRRDRRGFQRARHSYLVTSASRNPRLSRLRLSSSPRRSPAPLRPYGLRDRGAERHHGYSPWTSIFYSQLQSRAFVPEARQIWNDSRPLPPTPTESLCQTGPAIWSEGDRRCFTIVVQCKCRDIELITFRQGVTDSGRLVLGQ